MGSSGKGRGKGAQSSGSFFGGGGLSHGEYMLEKNRKLKEQFAAAAQGGLSAANLSEAGKVAIFKGCSFWMTGRTCIPDKELKRLIVEHGGVYEQYGFTRVSHVIADNLAAGNQTWGELKRRLKRCNVVTSSWVTDSVREGKRIPETRYMPKCLQASSSMLSFMGQSSDKRTTSEATCEESSGAAKPVGRLGRETHGEGQSLSPSVIEDATHTEDSGALPQQAESSSSSVRVESQYGGDIEDPQLQQSHLKRRYPSAPQALAARKRLQSDLDRGADITLGNSMKTSPAVLPPQPLRAPSPLALEISTSCPDGLRGGLSELHELLAELGTNAYNQLKDAQRPGLAAGLQISVEEPCLHEWSSTADLAAGPNEAEELRFVLRCLAGRAVITLGLINPAQASGSSSGPLPSSAQEQVSEAIEGSGLLAWSTVRRVAIQVRCGPVPIDRLHSSTDTATGMTAKDTSSHQVLQDFPPETKNNCSSKTDANSILHTSDDVERCNKSSGGLALNGNRSEIRGALGKNNSMERTPCSQNNCSDITVVGDCSDSAICEVDEVIACSRSPLRVHRSKRPRWKNLRGAVSTDMSAEQLMHSWRASCQTHPGISRNEVQQLSSNSRAGDRFAERVRTASLSCHVEAFQLLVAKHEMDVVLGALRALQASAECRVVSTLHVDGLPPHSCFNMLLSKVQWVVSKATAGARLHIQPLPKET